MKLENERLLFVELRDGKEGVIDFARRTLKIYRMAIKRNREGKRSGYAQTYRRSLILSCLDFREYLRS
jgi:hypothetical protein